MIFGRNQSSPCSATIWISSKVRSFRPHRGNSAGRHRQRLGRFTFEVIAKHKSVAVTPLPLWTLSHACSCRTTLSASMTG